MNKIHYTVSHNGRHLFDTKEVPGFDVHPELGYVLTRKFPAEEGYRVTQSSCPAVYTTIDLHNRTKDDEARDANERG